MEPAQATTVDEVRLTILRHHTQLAELLDELEAHAKALIIGGRETTALHDALGLLHTRFLRHAEYEEAHLSSLIHQGEASPLGDHADQRARIEGLLHDRSVFGDPRTLAREVCTFVHILRKDMEGEDLRLRAVR